MKKLHYAVMEVKRISPDGNTYCEYGSAAGGINTLVDNCSVGGGVNPCGVGIGVKSKNLCSQGDNNMGAWTATNCNEGSILSDNGTACFDGGGVV